MRSTGTRGLTTLPTGDQEPLVVKTRVDELGVSKFMECDTFLILFSLNVPALLVGQQEGHLSCIEAECWYVSGDSLTAVCMSYRSKPEFYNWELSRLKL